jgi:hypothetical protein
VAVILAVPLAIIGPVSVLTALKIDNNLYIQISFVVGQNDCALRSQSDALASLENQ